MVEISPSFWSPHQLDPTLPVYLAIVEALESDILSGRLQAGEKLPPQRLLAQKIGVDFTTVQGHTSRRLRVLWCMRKLAKEPLYAWGRNRDRLCKVVSVFVKLTWG